MSDIFIFVFGCFVTLIVAASVSLLMWGAANEPEDGESLREEGPIAGSVRVSSSEAHKVGS